jgi:hypothetical protein
MVKNRFHLAGRIDIKRHNDRCFKFSCEGLDVFFCFVIEISDGKLCPESSKSFGAPPRDRILVGDSDDESPFAFEKFGFHSGYHRESFSLL